MPAPCAVEECFQLESVTNTATELIDYASNTYYAYFSTPATYTAASAKCASLQPVPGIVFKGTLWCIGSHSEHLLVESYFRSQMPSSFGSYWFGLRQPGMGAGAWSRYAFAWEDGSTPPSLNPSGQNYDGPGYSHWSTYNIVGSTKGSSPDPNNAGNSNQQCAAATTYHVAFSYYAGPFTTAGRNLFSNYIKDANSSRNLIGWNDRPCTELYTYICELVGEAPCPVPLRCCVGCGLPAGLLGSTTSASGSALRRIMYMSCVCTHWRWLALKHAGPHLLTRT